MIGTSLSHYQITAALGAGGMGEVWRATDEKLGREVALKLLPEDFASDPDRHARFEREAEVLASLNHPNIATLFGLEHLDGQHVLVMELVEGEGLDDVIARGPVEIDLALQMALQIADALEAAHEAGIVHRDLKPANVRIRPDGTVKVLDFGLAKEWDTESGDSSLSISPTMTRNATAAGVILGTAAYMAPEQARGKPVDKRADIWAFGVVVWEMLTGRKIFDGDTVTDIIAAVVTKEPDWEALPPHLSPAVTRILRRCMSKDLKSRFRDIGDVRMEIEGAGDWAGGSVPNAPVDPVAKPSKLARLAPWILSLAAMLAVVPLAMYWLRGAGPKAAIQSAVLPPQDATFRPAEGLALSPGGTAIAFVAQDDDGERIWIRRLDTLVAQRLAGTEGADYPFWSPDGQQIGFFADGKLKRIPAAGGSVRILADASAPRGGCWLEDGQIVYAADYRAGLMIVPSAGGKPRALTEPDDERGEKSHRWPIALPGGEHLIFLSQTSEGGTADDQSGLDILSLADGSRTRIIDVNSSAAYAPPGHLFYWHDGSLVVRAFDTEKFVLVGEQMAVAEGVGYTVNEMGVFSVSETGVLTYHLGSGVSLPSRLQWFDRQGNLLSEAAPVGLYTQFRLSPDGRQVSFTEGLTIWVRDLVRGTNTRVTFDEEDHEAPVWSPDGRWLAFGTTRTNGSEVRRKPSNSLGDEDLVFEFDKRFVPRDWSPDGNLLVFETIQPGTEWDVWVYSFEDNEARPLVATPFSDIDPYFSPDGRFVVYASNESGRTEVHVVPASGERRKWQVSTTGGSAPIWSPTGDEIFYVDSESNLTSVTVSGKNDLVFGNPQTLFKIPVLRVEDMTFDVAPDGQRFLVNTTEAQETDEALILVQNWENLVEVK